MQIETIEVQKLKNWEKNPREIDEDNYQALKKYIEKWGLLGTLKIDGRDGVTVLGGNMRLKVAKDLGIKEVNCEVADVKNDEEALEIALIDNNQFGSYIKSQLIDLVEGVSLELKDFNIDLKPVTLESLIPKEIEEDDFEVPDEDEIETDIVLGDIFELGNHRLMCGDSTKIEDVEKLMDGQKADMVFTDPPYGIGKDIINDNLKADDWLNFYRDFTTNMLSVLKTNGYFYVWGYFDFLSNYWENIVKERGDCNFRNFIIYVKKNVQGINAGEFRQYPEAYEASLLCIYGQPFQNGPWSTSPNAKYYWEGYEPIRRYLDDERKKMGWDIPTMKKIVGHSNLSRDHWVSKSQWSMPTREVYEKFQEASRSDAFRKEYDELRKEYDELRGYHDNSHGFTDVWQFDKLTTNADHPTVKPLEVCIRGIITSSRENEVVLDVFGGSGSTLIACEQTDRKCYMMEIDPKYCEVICQRWEKLTGKERKQING